MEYRVQRENAENEAHRFGDLHQHFAPLNIKVYRLFPQITRLEPFSHSGALKLASNSVVLSNFLQALFAIILGNLTYFLLASHLLLPRHRPFQMDAGLIVDFFFCLIFYVFILKANSQK